MLPAVGSSALPARAPGTVMHAWMDRAVIDDSETTAPRTLLKPFPRWSGVVHSTPAVLSGSAEDAMPAQSGSPTSETLPPAIPVHVFGAGPVGLIVTALLQ